MTDTIPAYILSGEKTLVQSWAVPQSLIRVLVHRWNQRHLDGAEVIPPSLFSAPPAAIEHIERRPKRRTEKSLQDCASDECNYIYIQFYIIYTIYIHVCVWCIKQYRSLCFTADEYSAGIKSRGLHFQSCYFVKGPMNSLDLCQFRYCLPPEARRSAVEKLLARAEDQHAKSRNGTGGWPWGGSPVDPNVTNYLFQQVDLLNQSPGPLDVNCLTLSLSGFIMLLFLHILNWGIDFQ